MRLNFWACALELGNHHHSSPLALEAELHNERSQRNEKPAHRNYRVAPTRHD